MESDKRVDVPDEAEQIYTPGQQVILKLLQWGAWTAIIMVMLYVMHS